MRTIEKGPEPGSLKTHRETPGADWDGYKGKREAFALLCEEQGYLCAYCMSRIKPDQTPRKIEHWMAQQHTPESSHEPSVHEENSMRWSNLLGVCLGVCGPMPVSVARRQGRDQVPPPRREQTQHCDTYRGNRPLAVHPVLQPGRCEALFRYRGSGQMWSDDPDAVGDIERLNLNVWRLWENRRLVLERVRQELPTAPGSWTVPVLRAELEIWRARDRSIRDCRAKEGRPAKGFRAYCQVAIQFLERQIRKRTR